MADSGMEPFYTNLEWICCTTTGSSGKMLFAEPTGTEHNSALLLLCAFPHTTSVSL